MFCIKCGVELGAAEAKCPLCGTVVYHPDITVEAERPTFPPNAQPKLRVNRRGALLIITALYLMLILQLLVCDYSLFGSLTWSLYASGGMLLVYIIGILPSWFPHLLAMK